MEEQKRKSEGASGEAFRLGNGELWRIPSLPCNQEGIRIADLFDEVDRANEKNPDVRKLIPVMAKAVHALLAVNYDITLEEMEETGLLQVGMYPNILQIALGSPKKALEGLPEPSAG
jgi:hypothetical protein